jgi:menaquinone-dependent protoporphyrinogen IX oxidase
LSKALVLYFTKYGSTKKYAEWITEELKGDIFDIKDARLNQLHEYDIILLGSALYAGNMKGINLFVDNYEKIKDKKLVLFTCGVADYSKEENCDSIYKRLEEAIPKNILDTIKIFYLRGSIDYKKLSFIHKIMMGMVRKMVVKKGAGEMNEENKEFLETFGKTVDFMDRESIKGIVEYCKT